MMDFSNYKTLNADKVMAHNPTLIGIVASIHFYEHPIYGDEAGLIAILPDKTAKQTDFYDMPTLEDLGFNLVPST